MIHEFAQLLLETGHLQRDQLDLLRHRASLMGGELDRHALEMSLLGADELIALYAQCLDLPPARPLDLDRLSLKRSSAFPGRLAARWRFIPVEQIGLSWQVLSDQKPAESVREEVRCTLGVELLVRAVPPFLFELLERWLHQRSSQDQLALLAARLFPRFSVPSELIDQKIDLDQTHESLEPSHLSYRLTRCVNGQDCLDEVRKEMISWAPFHGLWRVDGPVLRSPSRALSIDALEGFSEVLSCDHLQLFDSVSEGWVDLCDDARSLKSLAIRPVVIAGRCVAVLLVGSALLVVDGRNRSRLDDAAQDLARALKSRLGQSPG